MKVKKAIIPAAGYGTRFLPATKSMPKEMLTIVDKPAIQIIVEEAVAAGIEDILIITGRGKDMIQDHFDNTPELEAVLEKQGKAELLKIVQDVSNLANVHYVRQKEALGLGHAVLCAKTFVGNEPFVVMLGDDIVDSDIPCTKQLIDAFETYQCSVVGVQPVDWSQVDKYGIVDVEEIKDRDLRVRGLVEKPALEEAPSNYAILGRYVLTPEIFDKLQNTKPGKNGEIQLTDALRGLLEDQGIVAHNFEGTRYDTGDKLGYLKATVEMGLRHSEVKDRFRDYLKTLGESL
ncbi:MAG: UTP--glucose-1-phosphate uridylyltransferase GalU [Acidaminobacter sp.]|nr:UTP--glucose-1-phosphate uridylyltransferase GalU [Acidaminobacter sp.]MDK9710460.1 UTP--glucose-1-phosphate uridylyltransferase GalU [Acidaminobacter sp.]MZQ96115.1 UTP--glucose-1-phosphate uridylyltransferase GalU [Acidaminobacter sp.]